MEACILPGVLDHQRLVVGDDMAAEGDLPRGFPAVQAVRRLEPLAMAVDQGDQDRGHVEQARGQLGQLVERDLREAVEELEALQGPQALCFGVGKAWRLHGKSDRS